MDFAMSVLQFPGPGPFNIPASYLAENRELFAKHGYDLDAIRSEAELLAALEHISSTEWSAVAIRMEAAAADPSRPAAEREFWADIQGGPGPKLR
jgi:hypothetical protein